MLSIRQMTTEVTTGPQELAAPEQLPIEDDAQHEDDDATRRSLNKKEDAGTGGEEEEEEEVIIMRKTHVQLVELEDDATSEPVPLLR